MKKRVLVLCLALALCLSLLPAPALAAELPKLPTPTDLRWGVDEIDEELPGCASWTMETHLEEAIVCFYSTADSQNPVAQTNWVLDDLEDVDAWSDLEFVRRSNELESGSYYFTVQLKGDGATYADSEIAQSDSWTYTKPADKLPAPTTPPVFLPEGETPEGWEASPAAGDAVAFISWTASADSGYDVGYYFSATDAHATDVTSLTITGDAHSAYDGGFDPIFANQTQAEAGYYYARVRALSRDITQIQNSDWSSLSAAYYYAGNGETPTSPTPSTTPSTKPSPTPSTTPSAKPSAAPSTKPSTQPSTTPSTAPSTQPSAAPVAVTGVELSRSKVSLKENETTVLTATVKPTNAANKGVYWTSSDTAVLSVSDTGKVTARKEGTATVTVTTLDGSFTAACTVTVTKAPSTVGGGGGGSSSGGGGGGGGGGGTASATKPTTTPSAAPSAQPSAQPSAKPIDTSKPASENFSDVVKDSWYEAGVTYVVQKGLFQGVADRTFAPQQDMTRAMLMTVLARLDGQDTQGGDAWYSKGMDWAVANGISDGTLPDSSVTREQLVTMLYRYAKATAAEGDLTAFADGNSVSDWAVDAMTWAVNKGILTGKDVSRLDPQGTATRAEVATIFRRFVENK